MSDRMDFDDCSPSILSPYEAGRGEKEVEPAGRRGEEAMRGGGGRPSCCQAGRRKTLARTMSSREARRRVADRALSAAITIEGLTVPAITGGAVVELVQIRCTSSTSLSSSGGGGGGGPKGPRQRHNLEGLD